MALKFLRPGLGLCRNVHSGTQFLMIYPTVLLAAAESELLPTPFPQLEFSSIATGTSRPFLLRGARLARPVSRKASCLHG